MKMVGYALFGIAILITSVFLLAPDQNDSKTAKAPKATMTIPEQEPASTAVAPKKTETQQSVEGHAANLDKTANPPSEVAQSQDVANKALDNLRKKEPTQDLLSKPGDLTFDPSEVPDFPPLPPLEGDDEPPVFDELPAAGFPEKDFGEGGFGDDEGFPIEGEPLGALGDGEF